MKCRILADHHEFGRKSQEVIPEKPKMCLKSPRVTVLILLLIANFQCLPRKFYCEEIF